MADVYYSRVMEASADRVWAVVRDFGSLALWFPFVEKSVLSPGGAPDKVGTVRSNTVAEGKIIQEQLLEMSDRDRRIVYSVVAGDVPTRNYSASLTVHTVTETGQAFVAWAASFDVDGEVAPVAAWVRDGIFAACLGELDRVLHDPA